MTRNQLTLLILELNAAIDRGQSASLDEVHEHIRARDVFVWLKKSFTDMDLSPYLEGSYLAGSKEISEGWLRILDAYAGNERRKWGVQNNGLCLLLAWTNELVQQGAYSAERGQ